MGKYKEKKLQTTNQSDSKSNGHRDGFFLKTKTPSVKKTPFSGQKNKDKVNNSLNETNTNTDQKEKQKKPFDKKQWRIKKYSNKYKVDQWKEMRKKKIINQYQRSTKRKDERAVDVEQIYEKYGELNSDTEEAVDKESKEPKGTLSLGNAEKSKEEVSNPSKPSTKEGKKNRNNFHDRIMRMKEEKLKKQEEYLKRKAEKEEALKLSRQKKAERYRKLNKRTKKGQPIMKDRMEMLYEQIQKICQQ